MSSDFYQRKRRLSYAFAGLSVLLLLAYLGLGFLLETYAEPRAAAAGDDLVVSWTTRSAEDEPGTRIVRLDPSLRPRGPAWRLAGEAGGVLADEADVTAFFGNRYSVLRDGSTLRGADLGQPWAVRAACRQPAADADWIFGVADGKILARRRELGTFSESLVVADAGSVERLSASVDGAAGPLVAWRESGSLRVRTALFDGRGFPAKADFDVGPVEHWDAALSGARALLATYSREDRSFKELGIRIRSSDGGQAALAKFPDPILFLGKKVTGLALAVREERLVIAVSRWTTLQAGSVPLATLLPEPDSRMSSVGAEPRWRSITGFFFPMALLFFSFSLVFLGFTLLRERGGFVLERLVPAAPGVPPTAAVLQRAMAFILDQIALVPICWIAVEVLNVSPETSRLDLTDPRLLATVGVCLAVSFAYHFLMEWLLGWTLGKKIIGIRVTELDGSPVGFRGALVRNLLRALDATWPLGVFLGMSVMIVTRRRQRLGDLAGRTMVVEERRADDAPPAERPERRLKVRGPQV
jgi:uncharacterized RDD family membrane protein YckC